MNVLQTQTTTSTPLLGPTPQSQSALASSDFETFLKMLTVQMQNQDPLNPIDSSDYAVQLATFSGVEQAVRTNQLLENLQSQFGMAQLAGWVGQEARTAAPIYVDGRAVTIAPNPVTSADRAVLVVRDDRDRVVSREDISASADQMDWAGTDATDAQLPTGLYTLSVESYFGDNLLRTEPVEHYATIIEARGGANGTSLILQGGTQVLATEIRGLRAS